MQSISNCSQYNPYAGMTTPCGGNVHELTVQRKDQWLKPNPIQVCDTHMPSFKALGQRRNYEFTIVEDKVIGVITPASQEGQKPSGKLES